MADMQYMTDHTIVIPTPNSLVEKYAFINR